MPLTTTLAPEFVTAMLQSREDPMAQSLTANDRARPSYRPCMTLRPCELKFAVDHDTGGRIREAARRLLAPDPNAAGPAGDQYRTTTLYFDTDDLAAFHRRGSYGRSKLRVRRYGDGTIVFLERKLRTKNILFKRRTTLALDELPLLTTDSVDPHSHIRWFQERLRVRRLSVICRIAYLRTARVGLSENGPVRLTLDDDLAVTPLGTLSFNGHGSAIPMTDRTIVELKFTGAIPGVFRRIVDDFALTPVRLSKYRLGVEATRPVPAR